MFFVISGYLITSNARRRWGWLGAINAPTFYVSRIARIMPCLLLLLVLVNGLAMAGVPIFSNHAPLGVSVSFSAAVRRCWPTAVLSAFMIDVGVGKNYELGLVESYLPFRPYLCN